MTIDQEFANNPRGMLWQEVATDPAILAQEQDVAKLDALRSEHYRTSDEVTSYYWNTGVPYITSEHTALGVDDIRRSYYWDKPTNSPSVVGNPRMSRRERNRERYANDPLVEFVELTSSEGTDIAVGHAINGKDYLVTADGKVISPAYPSIQHTSGNIFQVPGYYQPGVLTALSEREREEALAKRAHLNALDELTQGTTEQVRDIQDEIATSILERYGVPVEAIQKHQSTNAVNMNFQYGGRHVRLAINGTHLNVITWDERLDFDQRMEVWNSYSSNKMQGVQISMMDRFLDTEIPDFLKPYEDRIMDSVDDINAEKREYVQQQNTFYERFGFLDFTLAAPHVSWALPIAMSIIDMPVGESYRLAGRMQSEGSDSMKVSGPGAFEPVSDKRSLAWRLSSDGSIERVKRTATNLHEDEGLAAAVQQLEAAKLAAAEEVRDAVLPEVVSEQAVAHGGIAHRLNRRKHKK